MRPFSRIAKPTVRDASTETTVPTQIAPSGSDSPFKVGDKVLIAEKDDMFSSGMPDVGTVDTIVSISNCGNPVLRSGFAYYASSLRHADYKFEVGDVVEFEYKYKGTKTCKGLIYQKSGKLTVRSKFGTDHWCSSFILDLKADRLRKIGHTDSVPSHDLEIDESTAIAKAYFLEQSEPKSYADRQAAWVKEHGIVKGSDVKVVRKFKDRESGCSSYCVTEMEKYVGRVGEVSAIRSGSCKHVAVSFGDGGSYSFPYFVLEPVK